MNFSWLSRPAPTGGSFYIVRIYDVKLAVIRADDLRDAEKVQRFFWGFSGWHGFFVSP